jgi:hypothetical protein
MQDGTGVAADWSGALVDLVAGSTQRVAFDVRDVFVVVDDEHPCHHGAS